MQCDVDVMINIDTNTKQIERRAPAWLGHTELVGIIEWNFRSQHLDRFVCVCLYTRIMYSFQGTRSRDNT